MYDRNIFLLNVERLTKRKRTMDLFEETKNYDVRIMHSYRVLIYIGEDVRRLTDDGEDVCRQCVGVCRQ